MHGYCCYGNTTSEAYLLQSSHTFFFARNWMMTWRKGPLKVRWRLVLFRGPLLTVGHEKEMLSHDRSTNTLVVLLLDSLKACFEGDSNVNIDSWECIYVIGPSCSYITCVCFLLWYVLYVHICMRLCVYCVCMCVYVCVCVHTCVCGCVCVYVCVRVCVWVHMGVGCCLLYGWLL